MRTRTTRCLTGRLTGLTAALMLTSTLSAVAQTPYVPYFGKNQIRYDNFRWHIYTTDHFEIYYYPEIEQHLERVAGYAESAYQQVSADLKHDLAFKIPLILFKTSSEFQQQNVIPGAAQEGVGAFAEPFRDRMVLPIDEPPDLLYRLVVHELTHIFEFDIIPQSLIRRSVPLWVNEGLSDYMTGIWRPMDLMSVRDSAVADTVPKMSELEGYGGFSSPRQIYNLGHAVFEFIESKWGKEGIRQFLFALRKSVIGGGEDAYEEAFQLKPEEFDQQFEKYLKDRFKAFRDKERPADYGRNLSPNPAEDEVHLGALHRAGALGRPDGRDGRQPARAGTGHRAAVDQGRHGRAQPDQGLRSGDGVCLHRHARRPVEHGVVDVVVAGGRPAGVLRPHRKREGADPAGRGLDRHQAPLPDEDRRRARVAVHRARAGALWPSRGCATPSATSTCSTRPRARSPTSPTTRLPTTRRRFRPTASPSSTWRASAATRSCSATTWTPRRRRSSPSARTTKARPSSSTAPRWCSRRRP